MKIFPEKEGRKRWRVYVGPFATFREADSTKEKLKKVVRRHSLFFNGDKGYFDSIFACTGPT